MSDKTKLKIGTRELVSLILIFSIVFFYFNYSWIGVRLIIGSLLLFFIPFYIFLDSFDLTIGEKLIFSFFIGLGIVPLVVYYFSKIFISLGKKTIFTHYSTLQHSLKCPILILWFMKKILLS